jgi:glycosyltransferase involved in cell wall biosynthesis
MQHCVGRRRKLVLRAEIEVSLGKNTPCGPPASPKRLRVMQVITHLGLGGAERVAFTLMKGLLDCFDFDLFAVLGVQPGQLGAEFQIEARAMGLRQFTGTNVPIKYGGMLLAGRQLAKAIKLAQPDVIHLHTEIPESAYAAAVVLDSKIADVPLVRTIHNSVYWTPWRRMGRWCERRMPRPFIAAVSQPALAAFVQLRQESGLRAPPFPPRLIFNGVSVERVNRNQDARVPGPIHLLFAGRFEDQKGADLLPEILRRVRPPRPCELTIYGRGTYERVLQQLASNPPPGWTVHLHPPVPNLSSLMSSFDLLLMPSRFEGLSLVAIESLLLGLPVVATSAPGLRDGFPADYPWMAPPGDAVAYAELLGRVLNETQNWPFVVESGRGFAREQFNVERMCEEYRKLYQDAVASANPIRSNVKTEE